MSEIQLLIMIALTYVVGCGLGYFACLYVNQREILAGRAAIARKSGAGS